MEDFEFDPNEIELSAREIACEMAKDLEVPEESKDEAIRALEFGVHAVDIFLNSIEDDTWQPLAMVNDIAELYVAFHKQNNESE